VATYFDSTGTDKLLLVPAVRTNADLVNVAAEAEKDVIAHYTARAHYLLNTVRLGSMEGTPELVNSSLGLYVFLRGYKVDANDAAVDTDLKAALKREIASVIEWRIRQRDVNTLTTSEADGAGKSVSLRADANAVFPPGFGRRLRPFDIREPVWGS
jgi:hypothetical protein